MHCLLTALGSYGDVHPMIGLGVALARRRYRVEVVSNPHFEPLIRGAGLGFLAVSSAEAYDTLTQRRDLWKPLSGMRVVFQYGVIDLLQELYEVVASAYRPGETVIAAHGLDLASRVAAESLGAPVASIVYAPMALWSDRSPPRMPFGFTRPAWLARQQFRLVERMLRSHPVQRALDSLRERVGLGPLRQRYFDWYYGVAPPVCLFPEWFAADPGDWPARTTLTGFPLWDGANAPHLPAEVEAFLAAGDPPLAFTPGSANRVAERFFSAAVGACQRLGRRGVLLTKYPEQLPAQLPDTVRWVGFQPLSQVLPRCDAFVHHGGIGSCAQGLAAGIVQLIQPLGFDQFDNAERLRRLGVGDELKPARFTASRVADKLRRLLDDPQAASRAQEIALSIDSEQALTRACEALIALHASR
ncbi:glycosyltransferase [Botrimarina hoheduenensis]|uniref:MurG-like transferase n=1 Tax=Botrimarina hoheduenensis TaxID=2528000 RepID=A0A5C5VV08_9BACT|nr:glycosyltransferase [Botrimarina hoheduenensis]TWT42476.1 MurG-like transferase [Botrimarina hoheduenensis]